MTTLMRQLLLQGGETKMVATKVCACVGMATRSHTGALAGQMWTPGRRGPEGGVCGACGGAIPTDNEKRRLELRERR